MVWIAPDTTPTAAVLDRIRAAAAADDPSALCALSNLVAAGYGTDRDWPHAIDLLARAARQDHGPAWRILGSLGFARTQENVGHADLYTAMLHRAAALHDSIALSLREEFRLVENAARFSTAAELLSQAFGVLQTDEFGGRPEPVLISERPRLYMAQRLYSGFECAYMRALAAGGLRPAKVYSSSGASSVQTEVRAADDVGVPPWRQDAFMSQLTRRIASVTSCRTSHAEAFTIVRYRPGGKFIPHFDTSEGSRGDLDAGRRAISFIAYLNEGYVGGETAFVEKRMKIAGAAGDAVFFHNLLEDGTTDPQTLHAGMPVEQGEKWICVQWFRERRKHGLIEDQVQAVAHG